VHDDVEMQAELVMSGEAIGGEITGVRAVTAGKAVSVYWTVESDGTLPLRLREGATLCPIGFTNQKLQILDIVRVDAKTNRFELEVTDLKKKAGFGELPASDKRLVGEPVTLVPPPMDGISRRKSQSIWDKDGPGGWLTHAVPKGKGMDLPDDVGEDLAEITGPR
jgi:hypothetical protein